MMEGQGSLEGSDLRNLNWVLAAIGALSQDGDHPHCNLVPA